MPELNVEEVLTARGEEYGEYSEMAMAYATMTGLWRGKNLPVTVVAAMDMIAMKLARLATGGVRMSNSSRIDTLLDIEGYARLARQATMEERHGKLND